MIRFQHISTIYLPQHYLLMDSHPLDTDSWRASRPKTSACTSRSAGARSDMVSLGLVAVWQDVENGETKKFLGNFLSMNQFIMLYWLYFMDFHYVTIPFSPMCLKLQWSLNLWKLATLNNFDGHKTSSFFNFSLSSCQVAADYLRRNVLRRKICTIYRYYLFRPFGILCILVQFLLI